MKTLAYTGIFTLLVFWGVKAQAQNVPAVRHYNQTTLGGAYGIGNVKYIDKGDAVRRRNKEWYAEFTTVNGVQYKNHQFGLGIGANIWKTKWFVPIFLQYKATFTNRKAKPYGSLDVGFSFGPERFNKQFSAFETNYLFLKPAFGIEVKLGKKNCLVANAFYKMQTLRSTYMPDNIRAIPYTLYYHFLGVGFGIKI